MTITSHKTSQSGHASRQQEPASSFTVSIAVDPSRNPILACMQPTSSAAGSKRAAKAARTEYQAPGIPAVLSEAKVVSTVRWTAGVRNLHLTLPALGGGGGGGALPFCHDGTCIASQARQSQIHVVLLLSIPSSLGPSQPPLEFSRNPTPVASDMHLFSPLLEALDAGLARRSSGVVTPAETGRTRQESGRSQVGCRVQKARWKVRGRRRRRR